MPHITSSASLSTLAPTSSWSTSSRAGSPVSLQATYAIPVAPQASDDSRGSGSSILFMKSGRVLSSSTTPTASVSRSRRVSAYPRLRRRSSPQIKPAAPT
jgi:hypothetical protein